MEAVAGVAAAVGAAAEGAKAEKPCRGSPSWVVGTKGAQVTCRADSQTPFWPKGVGVGERTNRTVTEEGLGCLTLKGRSTWRSGRQTAWGRLRSDSLRRNHAEIPFYPKSIRRLPHTPRSRGRRAVLGAGPRGQPLSTAPAGLRLARELCGPPAGR